MLALIPNPPHTIMPDRHELSDHEVIWRARPTWRAITNIDTTTTATTAIPTTRTNAALDEAARQLEADLMEVLGHPTEATPTNPPQGVTMSTTTETANPVQLDLERFDSEIHDWALNDVSQYSDTHTEPQELSNCIIHEDRSLSNSSSFNAITHAINAVGLYNNQTYAVLPTHVDIEPPYVPDLTGLDTANRVIDPDHVHEWVAGLDTTPHCTIVLGSAHINLRGRHTLYMYNSYYSTAYGLDTRENLTLYNLPHQNDFDGSDLPVYYVNEEYNADAIGVGRNYPVAQLTPGIVYLPFTCERLQYPEQMLSLMSLIHNAIEVATNDSLENWEEQMQQRHIDHLLTAVNSINEGELHRLEQDLNDQVSIAQRSRRDVTNAENRIRQLQPQIEAIRTRVIPKELTNPDYLKGHVNKILSLPYVEKLEHPLAGYHLNVRTKLMPMTVQMHDGEEYTTDAGLFNLHLNFTSPDIRIDNEPDYMVSHYQHPHISGGDFCLGGARRLVYDLMTQLQFSTAVEVLIDQLGTVNPDDCFSASWYEFFADQLDSYHDGYSAEEDEEY